MFLRDKLCHYCIYYMISYICVPLISVSFVVVVVVVVGRHLKGKVFILLQNSNLATFRRFQGKQKLPSYTFYFV